MAALPHTAALEPITTRCASCHGTGLARQAIRATCGQCGRWWTPARIAQHFDGQYGGWWGYRVLLVGDLPWLLFARLPCGHLKRHLDYRAQECRTCRGTGVVTYLGLSQRYVQRQRAQLAATLASRSQRPRTRGYPDIPPMRATTRPLKQRLATAPVSSYVRNTAYEAYVTVPSHCDIPNC